MKLVNPTDEELNSAFANKVAGIESILNIIGRGLVYSVRTERGLEERRVPNYVRSADDVMPFIKPNHYLVAYAPDGRNTKWEIELDFDTIHASGPTFAYAAVVALLRYSRIEIEFTK